MDEFFWQVFVSVFALFISGTLAANLIKRLRIRRAARQGKNMYTWRCNK